MNKTPTCCSGVWGVSCSHHPEGCAPGCASWATRLCECQKSWTGSSSSCPFCPEELVQKVLRVQEEIFRFSEEKSHFKVSKVCYLLSLSLVKRRLEAMRPTQVILKLLGASVLSRGNQVPHEAFDFVVSTVMDQAVRQQGPADGFYIPLCQLLLKTAMFENIFPTAPPGRVNIFRKSSIGKLVF